MDAHIQLVARRRPARPRVFLHTLSLQEAQDRVYCRGEHKFLFPSADPRADTPQAQYWLATLALGFPVFTDMRRQVQDARIESIMKGK